MLTIIRIAKYEQRPWQTGVVSFRDTDNPRAIPITTRVPPPHPLRLNSQSHPRKRCLSTLHNSFSHRYLRGLNTTSFQSSATNTPSTFSTDPPNNFPRLKTPPTLQIATIHALSLLYQHLLYISLGMCPVQIVFFVSQAQHTQTSFSTNRFCSHCRQSSWI